MGLRVRGSYSWSARPANYCVIRNPIAFSFDERARLEVGWRAHELSIRDQIAFVDLDRDFDEIVALAETIDKLHRSDINPFLRVFDVANELFPCDDAAGSAFAL